MITASYVSPAMKALHMEAESAGIVILNELGLDPGTTTTITTSAITTTTTNTTRVLSNQLLVIWFL